MQPLYGGVSPSLSTYSVFWILGDQDCNGNGSLMIEIIYVGWTPMVGWNMALAHSVIEDNLIELSVLWMVVFFY